MFRIQMTRFPSLLLALVFFWVPCSEGQDNKVIELGRATFQSCVACHGPDGKGVKAGDLQMAPSLHDSKFIKEDHPEELTAIVLKGILKEGNEYIQAMLALEAALNDEQIAALISYVTQEFGGKRRKVTPSEVADFRKEYRSRKSPWKRSELEEMLLEAAAPKLLSNVRYSLYPGEWKKLPDFSSLTPTSTGELKKGQIALNPAKEQKKGFGMVFDADLTIPESGDYIFALTSDDGSALIIDGETIVGNDGIHPAKTTSMKEALEAGNHTIQVQYFDGGGNRNLSLSVKGPRKMGTMWLSSERTDKKKTDQSFPPIPLSARNPGEAIVQRSFLPDANPRAIGVGYPGEVNLVWDADVLNLAYVYRGRFMDASTEWNGRGSASTPLGTDRVKIVQGLPFQMLESLDEPWQPFSEAKVKYERDTADPQKEITLTVRHPDYQFHGYRLDEKRFPTFSYDYRKLTVKDRYTPEEINGVTSLVRTLTFSGDPEENVYLRIADSGPQTMSDGWIDVGGNLKIKIAGEEPISRKSGDKNETLVPITSGSEIVITYRWNTPLKP
jgi:mono/diheme cytochrome c family protein